MCVAVACERLAQSLAGFDETGAGESFGLEAKAL